jgi:hypothetical protein
VGQCHPARSPSLRPMRARPSATICTLASVFSIWLHIVVRPRTWAKATGGLHRPMPHQVSLPWPPYDCLPRLSMGSPLRSHRSQWHLDGLPAMSGCRKPSASLFWVLYISLDIWLVSASRQTRISNCILTPYHRKTWVVNHLVSSSNLSKVKHFRCEWLPSLIEQPPEHQPQLWTMPQM